MIDDRTFTKTSNPSINEFCLKVFVTYGVQHLQKWLYYNKIYWKKLSNRDNDYEALHHGFNIYFYKKNKWKAETLLNRIIAIASKHDVKLSLDKTIILGD